MASDQQDQNNPTDTNPTLEQSSKPSGASGMKLLISFGTQLYQIQLPDNTVEPDFHVVQLVLDGERAVDVKVNGFPVSPETGEPVFPANRDDLLLAAERLAEVWAEAGWKISKDHSLVQGAYENWLRAKTGRTLPEPKEYPSKEQLALVSTPLTVTKSKEPPRIKSRIVREDGAKQHPDANAPIPPIKLPDVSEEELRAMEACTCPGPCEVHPGAGTES